MQPASGRSPSPFPTSTGSWPSTSRLVARPPLRALGAWERTLTGSLPSDAVVARISGDEWAVALPGATAESALIVLEEIRSHFASHRVDGIDADLSVSIGIAARPPHAPTIEEAARATVEALIRAKRKGPRTGRHLRRGEDDDEEQLLHARIPRPAEQAVVGNGPNGREFAPGSARRLAAETPRQALSRAAWFSVDSPKWGLTRTPVRLEWGDFLQLPLVVLHTREEVCARDPPARRFAVCRARRLRARPLLGRGLRRPGRAAARTGRACDTASTGVRGDGCEESGRIAIAATRSVEWLARAAGTTTGRARSALDTSMESKHVPTPRKR